MSAVSSTPFGLTVEFVEVVVCVDVVEGVVVWAVVELVVGTLVLVVARVLELVVVEDTLAAGSVVK
jgi:hypothetical protein